MWRSTFIVSAMTLLSRILGLVRDMVLLNVFGAGGIMDAFLVAFKIPNFFRRLFAEGAFSQAFIPVLTEYKTKKLHQDVQILISRAAGSLTLILSLLTVFTMLAAPAVIWLFAPGFADEPDKFELAVDLLRLTFPYLLLMSLTAFASSVLNSYGSFATASFAPVLLNLTMIAAAWWCAPLFDPSIMALGWAVVVAGVLQLAIQIPELWKKKLLIPPKVDFKHEGVRRILKLMLPALFGVSVVQINLLLNTVWASFMQTGSVTWLYSAERLTELPLGLIGIAIATVILPALSAKNAEQDMDKFRALIDWAARVIVLVGIPASIAMFMLASPIIQALFQHGEFGAHDVAMTALALQGMSLSILTFMLIKIFAPAFYARQDTKTPVKIGLISVGVNIALNVVLIGWFKWIDYDAPHVALALSSTVASCVNAGMLYWYLHRQDVYRFGGHWRVLILRYGVANIAMVAVLWVALPYYPTEAHQLVRVMALLGLCVAGGGAYAVGLLAMGFRPRHIAKV
jgi:putative peptidoglycan lipid II flippase